MRSKLKVTSQNILDEILAQLKHRREVLRGLKATLTIKELAYRRGMFVVKKIHQEQQVLDDEQRLGDLGDPCDVLLSSDYSLEELPENKHNVIRIQAKPARPGKFNIMNLRAEDHQAAIAVITKTPARLVEMKLLLVNLPWWINWLLKSVEARVEFEYIRGVPVPTKSSSRIQSKGLGWWRIGGGEDIEVQYKE
jgi:hypothetical protein